MKAALVRLGIVQELDPVIESAAERSARSIRSALQFTWATMSAYLGWRMFNAWEQTQTVACVPATALSTTLLLLPIASIAVAIAHLNRRLNGRRVLSSQCP